MKKRIVQIIIFICLIGGFIVVLNLKVTTHQGLNYTVYTKKIPLYFKAIGFIYRHFAYKQLVADIIKDSQTDEEKVLTLFNWTSKNIRKIPKGFPVFDDHILNIIIRGYGSSDQAADVFCMLCEYAGISAGWTILSAKVSGKESGPKLVISLVKLDGSWKFFDTRNKLYLRTETGKIASVDDIIADPELIDQIDRKIILKGVAYKEYLKELKTIENENLWRRGEAQMPMYRLKYESRKLFKRYFP